MTSLEPRSLFNMPNLRRLLKYVPATSSAFFSHQNISKNTYFQITKVVKFHFMCTLRLTFNNNKIKCNAGRGGGGGGGDCARSLCTVIFNIEIFHTGLNPRSNDISHQLFTPWSEWSPCSKTCGAGFRARKRSCINPKLFPSLCHGLSIQHQSCFDRLCAGRVKELE